MKSFLSVRPGLQRHMLESDLLIYDPSADAVHLLNPTAASVLEMIEAGFSADQIIGRLDDRADESARGSDLFDIAIDQLSSARLLSESASFEQRGIDTTRRQALQKIAAVGIGLMVPAILTLTPSSAYAQGSGLGNGAACESSQQCASGCCQQGNNGACPNKICVNPAASCAVCRSA
jgi:hypothetical protein